MKGAEPPGHVTCSDLFATATVTDLGQLSTYWQQSGEWWQGDFDYCGFVDVTDLGLQATRHRYPEGDEFWRFHSSGNHWPIWLIAVAGRFVSNCVR